MRCRRRSFSPLISFAWSFHFSPSRANALRSRFSSCMIAIFVRASCLIKISASKEINYKSSKWNQHVSNWFRLIMNEPQNIILYVIFHLLFQYVNFCLSHIYLILEIYKMSNYMKIIQLLNVRSQYTCIWGMNLITS